MGKRGRKATSDSDDDVSLEEESDWAAEEDYDGPAKSKRKKPAAKQIEPDDDVDAEINEEDLIRDEEDRQRLMKMSEFEREMELAERKEALQEDIQRKQLLRAVDAGAGTARRSGREVREEAAKKSAFEELRAARQRKARGQKAQKEREEKEEEDKAQEDREEELGREDEGVYSDYEEGEAMDILDDEEGAEEASWEDIKTIQVRRHKLEEWITKPHFRTTLPGCFVRLQAGQRRDEQGQMQPIYMIAQIVDVEERAPGVHKYMDGGNGWKTPYPFGPQNTRTSLWLRVRRGSGIRYWPLAQVSNSSITDKEFDKWQEVCHNCKVPQVIKREVADAHNRLVGAENFVYTAEEVQKLLEEKRAVGKAPRNFALEKANIERAKAYALEAGQEEEAALLQQQIDALEAAVKAKRGSADSMARLNRKNADLNFQTAFGGGKKVKEEEEGGASTLDPFSRRVTRPMIYWKTGEKKEQEENGDVGGIHGEEKEMHESKVVEQNLVDLSGLDLSLLDQPVQSMYNLTRRLLSRAFYHGSVDKSEGDGRRTITLTEYNRRYGGL